jgi:hypothetical protein
MAIRSDELQAFSPEIPAFLAMRSPQAMGMVAVGEFQSGEHESPVLSPEFRRRFMICDPVRQEVLNRIAEKQFEPEQLLKLSAGPDPKTDVSLNGEEWTLTPDEMAITDILTNNRGEWVSLRDVLPSLLIAPKKTFLEGRREVFAKLARGLNSPKIHPATWIEKRGQSLDSQYRFAPFVVVPVALTEEQGAEADEIMKQLGILPNPVTINEKVKEPLIMHEDFRRSLQVLDPEMHARRNEKIYAIYEPDEVITLAIHPENRITVNGVEKPTKTADTVALLGVFVNNPETSFYPRDIKHGIVFGDEERSPEAKGQGFNHAKNYIKDLAGEGKTLLAHTGNRTSRQYALGPNVVVLNNTNVPLPPKVETRPTRSIRLRRLPAKVLPEPEVITSSGVDTASEDVPPSAPEQTHKDGAGTALGLLGDMIAGKQKTYHLSNDEILDARRESEVRRIAESTLPKADIKDELIIGKDERPTMTNEVAKDVLVQYLRGDTDVMPSFGGAMGLRQLRILLSTIHGEAAELGLGGSKWSKRFLDIQLAHNREISEEVRKKL